MASEKITSDLDFEGKQKLVRPVLATDALANEGELGYNATTHRPKVRTETGEKDLMAKGDTMGDISLGAGLTTASNAITLDLTSKALVSLVITHTWVLKKNDGLTSYGANSNTKNLVVDKGCKVDLSATFQYPAPSASQAAPTSVSGSWGTSLPAAGVSSPALAIAAIATSQSFYATLAKPKSGLIVVGSQVQFASGNDSTTDSISISFQGRGVLAYFTQALLTAADIEGVLNTGAFQTSKARTFTTVTASGGKYTYYLLDAALLQPTSVIQNGALPVFGAFQFLAQVNITNAAGLSMPVIVMRSNGTDAFSNATLAFS